MRTRYFHILAVLCLLALASSCEKDYTGKAIRFRATSRPDSPSTKTAYSGSTYSGYERIDWVDGDKILLAMKNNETASSTQTYQVTGIAASSRYSTAGLLPYGTTNGLEWGTGTHDFWAAYPSTATAGDHSFTAAIPASQNVVFTTKTSDLVTYKANMDYAFMVAGLQQDPTDDGIDLDFYPAVTTFDFTVSANSNFVITQVELETTTSGLASNVALCGNAIASFNPSSAMAPSFSSSSDGQSITVLFKNSNGEERNPSISSTTALNFKLFALPKNITGVRIKFTLGTGAVWMLDLKQDGEWITFPACSKINITGLLIPGAVWYINFAGPREETWVVNPDIVIGVE